MQAVTFGLTAVLGRVITAKSAVTAGLSAVRLAVTAGPGVNASLSVKAGLGTTLEIFFTAAGVVLPTFTGWSLLGFKSSAISNLGAVESPLAASISKAAALLRFTRVAWYLEDRHLFSRINKTIISYTFLS